MAETPFEVGPLRGHRGGSGPPALLLHGGAAVPDYLDGLAEELGGLVTTYRYTQRGTSPSGGGPPFTIEQHMADALSDIESRRRAGAIDEADLVERFRLVWPGFFGDRERMLPPPERVGVEASVGTNRSIAEHFERGTLRERLPEATHPVLIVHGELSALPVRSSVETAALVPGAELVVVSGAAHFPWVDVPGSVRDAVEPFLREG